MKYSNINKLVTYTPKNLQIILTSGEVYKLNKSDSILFSVDSITIIKSNGSFRIFPTIQVQMIQGKSD